MLFGPQCSGFTEGLSSAKQSGQIQLGTKQRTVGTVTEIQYWRVGWQTETLGSIGKYGTREKGSVTASTKTVY